MKKKSIGFNAVLNGIKNLTSVIFPLITFPYVSRVLMVENLGKYNFSFSVVDYFILIAALGISTYAIREGARIRENKDAINRFACEVFTINLISMLISYVLLVIVVLAVPKLHSYWALITIFSAEIFFRVIGTEWLYSIYEEYAYITIRSIAFHIMSIVLMFIFVKKAEDYYIYTAITVLANAGNNMLNFFNAKRFCKLRIVRNIDYKKHLKPILTIFSISIATTIYVSSDTTILGFMTSDYEVGLYSVSVKIYKVIKTCLSAVLIVSIPRLSHYLGTNELEKYNSTFNKIFKTLITVVIPVVVGVLCTSKQMVLIIAGGSFLGAVSSLNLLSIALIVCLFGWIYNSCVMIPHKKEKQLMYATITSAMVNVVLNLVLIPFWKGNAAAFTTILAEACTMIMCMYYSRGLVKIENIARTLVSALAGSAVIVAVCMMVNMLNLGLYLHIVVAMAGSAFGYAVVVLLLKNPIAIYTLQSLMNRLKKQV